LLYRKQENQKGGKSVVNLDKKCCDHVFTAKDIKGPLMNQQQALGNNERGLLGGNVKRFADAECPQCGKKYLLWLKPEYNTYTVKAISLKPNVEQPKKEEDEPVETFRDEAKNAEETEEKDFGLPDANDRDAIKAWLDEREIPYHPRTSTENLYELVLQAAD